jgi:polysaccharide biosynthesis transport protein
MNDFEPVNPRPLQGPLPPSSPAIMGSSPRPPGLSSAPDALSLFVALRRRLGLALGLALSLGLLVGMTTIYLVPRAKYTARATLQISTNPKRIIFDPSENRTDYRTYQRTQVAVVKDRKIINDALRRLGELETIKEQPDADEWLMLQLKVEFIGGSEIMELSLSGDHPEDLAKIVNEVIESYISLAVEKERNERQARLLKLRNLWERYQGDLNVKRKELRDMVQAVGANDAKALAMSQQFSMEHLSTAQKEKMRVQTELLKARSEIAVLEAKQEGTTEPVPPESLIGEILGRDENLERLRAKVEDLSRRYQEVRRAARNDNDPALVAVHGKYESAINDLRQLRAKARLRIIESYHDRYLKESTAGLNAARQQVSVWQAYGEALEKDIARLQAASREIAGQSMDLETQRSEIAIRDDVARKVGAEVEAVEVELGAGERVGLLSKATVPKKKDELKQFKIGAIAAVATFSFILFGVSFWEFRARRISTADEVTSGLGIRLIGSLPALPRRQRRAPRVDTEKDRRWQRLLIESVDATRAMLLHASRSESIRVVMIASAVSGEAKTSLSCHLATSLARAGRRTLLLDCDLRNPCAHQPFDVPTGPGLCEILRGEARAEDVVQETPVNGLHLIQAGRNDAFALQALSREEFRDLLAVLRKRYDFIIIDSAPILLVADSLAVGQSVDAVLFSILREVSRMPLVFSAYERLELLGVRMLGAVVTGVAGVTGGTYYSNYSYTKYLSSGKDA